MSLLKEGLRSDYDYPVYRKRNAIPILMTHYSSLLTDSLMKVRMLLLTISYFKFFVYSDADLTAHQTSKFVKCCCH